MIYDNANYNKISSIVDHFLIKKGLTEHYFNWALAMCLWNLRELRLDTFQDLKTQLYTVTDRRTVVLDPCTVDVVKIGAPIGQYVVTLGVNSKLRLTDRDPNTTDVVAGLLSQNLPNGLDFNSYSGYYFFNYNGSSVQSFGGGFNTKGSYRFYEHNGVKELLLDYDYLCDQVYVEYITDGFDPCGETVVNPYFADYLLKGLDFSWEEEKEPNRTEASIARRGRAMRDAFWVVKGRKNDLDPQTMLNISRSGVRFTARI